MCSYKSQVWELHTSETAEGDNEDNNDVGASHLPTEQF